MRVLILVIVTLLFLPKLAFSQNVGIGTGNPQKKLDVHGSVKILDSLGIGVQAQKAKFHVKDDGIVGQRTIVGVLESNLSDRPTLLFSEFPTSEITNGMSIEYHGAGSAFQDRLLFNKSGGETAMSLGNNGNLGLGVEVPTEKLHVHNGSLLLSNLGATKGKGFLLGEDSEIAFGWIYDGIGIGSNNNLHLREYLGAESDIMTIKGDGKIFLNNLASTDRRPLYVSDAGEIITGESTHFLSGTVLNFNEEIIFNNIHLPQGATIKKLRIFYRDNSASERVTVRLIKTGISNITASESVELGSTDIFSSTSYQTETQTVPSSFGVIDNENFHYTMAIFMYRDLFHNPTDLSLQNYRIEYTY